ncbi:hypothetical protein L2E82_01436 [Cichorium intybus]|uniref:Uncharacterized protein n=1 Tax=Cichorium intybus TaxID=13427 RepID=A0ACB9GYL8_CICIN|nr:hypothetical protein L2E82_01436 [Cichorium intybus]
MGIIRQSYGEKQVKGSENPGSYYKCTSGQFDSVVAPKNSSISDDLDRSSCQRSRSGGDELMKTNGSRTFRRLLPVIIMEIALFSPSSLFHDEDATSSDDELVENSQNYVERSHQFPGMELLIREFSFHQMNANLLWPGTFAFAEWLVQDKSRIERRRIIELGSGTGALAIFLKKLCEVDITTSDYDDQEIEENIAHNCRINGVTPVFPHIKHSWGDPFPNPNPEWDLIIASDILLYVKQYPNLIKTLCFLLNSYKPQEAITEAQELPLPAFLMSWKRRIGKEEESLFFTGCENAGLQVQHLGSRVYCITPKHTTIS